MIGERIQVTQMPKGQHFDRIDTLELRSQIEKKVGRVKTENYLDLLSRFLSCKVSKSDFDKLCIATIGSENICLHNALLRGIIKNVCLSKTPPSKRNVLDNSLGETKELNGFQRSISFQSLCKDLPRSPRRGRTPNIRDRRFKDSKGKSQVSLVSKKTSPTEVVSSGGRPPCSIEDGEEVDQLRASPGTHSRSHPIEAPLGVSLRTKMMGQKVMCNRLVSGCYSETCSSSGELLDTGSLKKKLEQTLGMEGLEVSVGFTNLLNMGLDIFLKRLIKPCLDLVGSRSIRGELHQGQCSSVAAGNGLCPMRYVPEPRASFSASLVDFQVAMGLNPSILGEDWPRKLEKISLLTRED